MMQRLFRSNQTPEAPRNSTRPTSLPDVIKPHKCDHSHSHQPTLKQRILQIQNNKALTPKEKAVSMQQVMMQKWNQSQESNVKVVNPATMHHNNQNVTTYHDEATGALGCAHYKRGCKLLANCCNKWYTCRFCHDEEEDHTLDRYNTQEISCMSCHTVQGLSKACITPSCGKEFAKYYCEVCRFYDNEEEKDIYHCDKCKICRIGKGLGIDYFHCDKCNACMSVTLQEHRCVERSLESNCPICSSYMFTSTTPVMFLPCGHCMHVSCYEEYTLTNYICPICSKSLGDMESYFVRIDELMSQETMPEEYKNYRSKIYCSDCERKCTAKFHFVYHKCQYGDCGSYNTKVIGQYVLADGAAEESVDPTTPRAPRLHQRELTYETSDDEDMMQTDMTEISDVMMQE